MWRYSRRSSTMGLSAGSGMPSSTTSTRSGPTDTTAHWLRACLRTCFGDADLRDRRWTLWTPHSSGSTSPRRNSKTCMRSSPRGFWIRAQGRCAIRFRRRFRADRGYTRSRAVSSSWYHCPGAAESTNPTRGFHRVPHRRRRMVPFSRPKRNRCGGRFVPSRLHRRRQEHRLEDGSAQRQVVARGHGIAYLPNGTRRGQAFHLRPGP